MKASTKPLLPALLLLALLGACRSNPTQPEPAGSGAGAPQAAAPVSPAASPQARFTAALELMKNGQNAEAEKAFQDLAKDQPNASGPWTNLGIIYAKTKRRDAAIQALARAAQLKPDNAVAWNWLGIEYREAGNYAQAQNAYEQALKANANDPLVHLNYGILLDQYLKRPQEAIAQYQQYQQALGKQDLRSMAWIAELQAANPAPAAPAAKPGNQP
ncbi:Tetratricopeptide repeat-containing protein [Solimonas aquatica]|uniref:Tetratricopeptide repeat-containing protein n=1 Tax=Solimonas aquatica TaxID=489703 RepID=A0A1H9HZ94_9GAMM|nr:tetratricopeptide repeat protein [Solimonas aquatica]SEQ67696.1 Tetratricopeptide repeat-containing protein [Solimonas aquatica]